MGRDDASRRMRSREAEPEPVLELPPLELRLLIRWHSEAGQTKVHALRLSGLASLKEIQGFTAYLMDNAYPEATRPAHLTSDAYAQYSTAPDDGILPLPGSIAKTDLRLILVHEGWEYAVHAAEVFSGARQDDRVHVATVEFEQRAHVMGRFGFTLPYIAYPLVSIKKEFIASLREQLAAAGPDGFTGIVL